jgi:hypothetical protein
MRGSKYWLIVTGAVVAMVNALVFTQAPHRNCWPPWSGASGLLRAGDGVDLPSDLWVCEAQGRTATPYFPR